MSKIQILGLRPYTDKKGNIKLVEKFWENNWRAKDVADLFLNIEEHLSKIPQEEHYNLYYTACHCDEEPGRPFLKQNIIPWDIDGIDTERIDEYITPILECIGASHEETGIVASGNGLQFIIGLTEYFSEQDYFKNNRKFYKTICDKINQRLQDLELPGEADAVVWSPSRLLRLPETGNIKTPEAGFPKKNSTKRATLIQRMIIPVDYSLEHASGVVTVDESAQITPIELKKFPKPDSEYVMQECDFLKWCKENPNEVSEENWYKMLSIVTRLEDGRLLAHEYSKGHKDYTEWDCERKADQALDSSGPRTCSNIGESFNCTRCPHYQQITSPILLHGEDYIKSKDNGFRDIKINKDGSVSKGKVNYEDLRKYFMQKHDYISCTDKSVYIWEDTYWKRISDVLLDNFAEKHVDPSPLQRDCNEFRALIQRTNLVEPDFFQDTVFRKINLKNGVLDLSKGTPEFLPHDRGYGFLSVLPYEYNPEAKCPRFDQFMREITLNRQELTDNLLEFAGYAFANEDCERAKSMILVGEGSNGKSTFLDVLTRLAGNGAYSSIPLNKLTDEKYVANLVGKLFNVTEETPRKAFLESSVFKTLVSGGDVEARHLYKAPFTMKNRAKLIMACNELPPSYDMTKGLLRRLIIVPFDASFEGDSQNIHIKHELYAELPGVLNRILEGYYRLRDNKNFTESTLIRDEIQEYQEDNDAIYQFYHEKIDMSNDKAFLESTDLYNAYLSFCKENGIKYELALTGFIMKLKRYIHDIKKRKRRRGPNRTSGYVGIALYDKNTY